MFHPQETLSPRPFTPARAMRPMPGARPTAYPGSWRDFVPPRRLDGSRDGTSNEPQRTDYLERLLQVLEFVARGERPLRLSQICAEMDLPMTTVHRLLTTLWTAGLLQRDAKRRYLLGERLVTLVGNRLPNGDTAS